MKTCIFKPINDKEIMIIEQRVFLKERTTLISNEQFQSYYEQCVKVNMRTYVHGIDGEVTHRHEPRISFWNMVEGFGFIVYPLMWNIILVLFSQLLPKRVTILVYILQGVLFLGFMGFILGYNFLMTQGLQLKHQHIQVTYSNKGYTVIGTAKFIYTMSTLGILILILGSVSYLFGQTVLLLLLYMPFIYIWLYYLILYFKSHYNRVPKF